MMVISGLSLMVSGCGSDRQGTLQLVRFESGAETQPDSVSAVDAQVDVCQNICDAGGGGGQETVEPFSSTVAAAVVVNVGKSDIFVDRINVSYPGSGLADASTAVGGGFAIPGGRCSGDAFVSCASDFECGGGTCINQAVSLPFIIFALERKVLIGGPNCTDGFSPESIQSFVTLSGRDADGERFTVSGGMNLEVADFNNCEGNA